MPSPPISAGISPSIVDLIGDTPLIRLRRIERDFPGVELYAKAEWKNPGGSVKDRPAMKMARPGAVMVVVFCDGGERYLSERFWENPPEGASICGTN